MELRPLGRTGISVSALCLGSMTWGSRNSESEGHGQLDRALERGINFVDTAEMYAVPPSAETYGATERVIGTWLKARKNRDKVVLATKVAGPAPHMSWVRGGSNRLNAKSIKAALEASLVRLQTDHVDLYQTHWPDRSANFFGRLGYVHDAEENSTDPAETLSALDDLVRAGKVRSIGLSNETPWGLASCLHLARSQGLPRVASVQNPYSLLNRTYEIGLAEFAPREDVGLLAYAPVAGGTLSGKYLGGRRPPGSRWALDGRGSRYDRPAGHAAVASYLQLARDHGLDPCVMALAFVMSRPFVTSAIFGATSLEQMENNLGCLEVTLSRELLDGIEQIHTQYCNPCP